MDWMLEPKEAIRPSYRERCENCVNCRLSLTDDGDRYICDGEEVEPDDWCEHWQSEWEEW